MNNYDHLTSKLFKSESDGVIHFIFWCPGCGWPHIYRVGGSVSWSFNDNVEKPTFVPSLLNHGHPERCHLFVTDGKIHYCGDCTHSLAGQTIDMVDMPDGWGESSPAL